LMICFERMLRRAALPFHSTQGYHPKPRLVFALSLALGIVGCDEVVELELDAKLPPEEIHARLARQAPAGLDILSVRRIERKMRAQVRCVTYRLQLPPQRSTELPDRVASVLAAAECWIERTRPQPRRLNLRPYVRNVRVLPEAVEIDLWVTPQGTARPDEVLGLFGLSDVLAAGAILERTHLEIGDENPSPGDMIPVPEGARQAVEIAVVGQPRATPLLPGPMTFDS
jgi:radical SAM-linked protein